MSDTSAPNPPETANVDTNNNTTNNMNNTNSSGYKDVEDHYHHPHKKAVLAPTPTVEEQLLDDVDPSEGLPLREIKIDLPGFSEPICFNPLVSGIGILFLWGLSIWSMADPVNSNETLVTWRGQITHYFTWLFVGARAMFFFFLISITIRYHNVKLGRKDEKPEFDDFNFFFMIFAAGVAVGLFVFGVSEPLYHRESHWYANAGYHSQDEKDNYAIFLTVNDWAIAGWACYLMVALAMGLAGHRFNLPMTFRSCFYPILHDYTWGWIGDVIDGITIVVTVAGVCTSLGLGALQIVAGFQYLGWVDEDISESKATTIANITIWAITAISTASVLSGLDAGIRFLSQLAFLLGMVLLAFVFIADDTKFFLNMFVQQIGYFLQWGIFEMNFWTDAYAQIKEGGGRATDGNAGAEWWMNAWLIFYQAWWVSWSAFVGLFVARISRGRTIGQVVTYSMVAPILYCILWFSVWGGAGIRQSRQADELKILGETHFNDTDYYQHPGSKFCYDVPQETVTYPDNSTFENNLKGVTPVCNFDTDVPDYAAFNVLASFSFPESFGGDGYGQFLNIVFIFALAIYFATSSDSGSLVVDHLSANGALHHHWLQRAFWAITEGAVATAVLSAGGSAGLQAVQAASIVFGLPFVFFLIFLVPCIALFAEQAAADPDRMHYEIPKLKTFATPVYGGIFNICELIASAGSVHPDRIALGMDRPTGFHVREFFVGLAVPFVPLNQILSAAYPRNKIGNAIQVFCYTICYYTWIALFIATVSYPGLKVMGWVIFFTGGCLLSSIRMSFRERYNIRSNVVADYLNGCFFWPQVLVQMREHCITLGLPKDKLDDDKNESVRKVSEASENLDEIQA